MSKKYLNDVDLQIAMTEYQTDIDVGFDIEDQYDRPIGTVSQVYDNEQGDGEQVYAVVADPTQDPKDVTEITVLFRGSTGLDQVFQQPKDVLNEWAKNEFRKHVKVYNRSSIYVIL